MRLRPAFPLTVAVSGLAVVAGCGGSSPSAAPATSPTPSSARRVRRWAPGWTRGSGRAARSPAARPQVRSGCRGHRRAARHGRRPGARGGHWRDRRHWRYRRRRRHRHATPTTPGTAPPRIVSFAVTQQPSCPEGDGPYRSPGSPAVVSWVVTGATSVTLSVDGPGAYGTYGPTGSVTLPFGCGGCRHHHHAHVHGDRERGTGPAAQDHLGERYATVALGPGPARSRRGPAARPAIRPVGHRK